MFSCINIPFLPILSYYFISIQNFLSITNIFSRSISQMMIEGVLLQNLSQLEMTGITEKSEIHLYLKLLVKTACQFYPFFLRIYNHKYFSLFYLQLIKKSNIFQKFWWITLRKKRRNWQVWLRYSAMPGISIPT